RYAHGAGHPSKSGRRNAPARRLVRVPTPARTHGPMSQSGSPVITRFFNQPVLLLVLTTLFWGGNTIAGRLAIGEVSPMAVVLLRWIAVSDLLLVLYGRQVRAEWPTLRRHLPILIAMGMFGFTAFN